MWSGDGVGVKPCAWPPLEGMDTGGEPELGVALVCSLSSPRLRMEMCTDLNKRSTALKNETENRPVVELRILFKFWKYFAIWDNSMHSRGICRNGSRDTRFGGGDLGAVCFLGWESFHNCRP